MFRLFSYDSGDTVYLRNFYNTPFTGDRLQEEVREAKVKKAIKQMGTKYLLAVPVRRITEGSIK